LEAIGSIEENPTRRRYFIAQHISELKVTSQARNLPAFGKFGDLARDLTHAS
jgi:hypothetical protein